MCESFIVDLFEQKFLSSDFNNISNYKQFECSIVHTSMDRSILFTFNLVSQHMGQKVYLLQKNKFDFFFNCKYCIFMLFFFYCVTLVGWRPIFVSPFFTRLFYGVMVLSN